MHLAKTELKKNLKNTLSVFSRYFSAGNFNNQQIKDARVILGNVILLVCVLYINSRKLVQF